ncbi:MAG: hypothetical protein GX754_12745 [Clostridiaceae bacterium]|nr:hypothetical protein [Clostridiaceae bacterium]
MKQPLAQRKILIKFSIVFIIIVCVVIGLSRRDFAEDSNYYTSGQNLLYYESYSSTNQNNSIYTIAEKSRTPQVFINLSGEKERLTDSAHIEFNPVVNNNGDYAYAVHEYSTAESYIVLNGQIIAGTIEAKGLYKILEIDEKNLVFIYERLYDDKSFICIYDLERNSLKRKLIPFYVQKMKFINSENILLQAFNTNNMSMDIYLYNLYNDDLTPLLNSKQDEILDEVCFDKYFTIDTVSGDLDAKLLLNAYYMLFNYQENEPFSNSNNFLGRLSWNQSYRLEALIQLWNLNNDEQIKTKINSVVENIMVNSNGEIGIEDRYNPSFLWASKKYSIDKQTPISLMVDDAKIIYPMLLAVNQGLIEDAGLADRIVENAKKMHKYYEPYYNTKENMYIFPKGIAFWADGIWMPFNQQNVYGLVLIELYKATDDELYKDRCVELAEKFKSEFVYKDGQYLAWHYWPELLYQGWTKQDGLSINTPEQEPQIDCLYEDTSHAGINVKFILEFKDCFGDLVFTGNDINMLKNTFEDKIITGKEPFAFSRFMSGDLDYQKPSFRFVPNYGWTQLKTESMFNIYVNLLPLILPDFDQQSVIVAYLNSIDEINPNDTVNIEKRIFDNKGNLLETNIRIYIMEDICEYFSKK